MIAAGLSLQDVVTLGKAIIAIGAAILTVLPIITSLL